MNRPALYISLSRGETRVVYIPPRAVILGVKGHATIVESVGGLGEASFSLCVPVRRGETHVLAYGGQVLLRATQSSSLHVIPPQPYFESWRRRCARLVKSVQHMAADVSRRLHGA